VLSLQGEVPILCRSSSDEDVGAQAVTASPPQLRRRGGDRNADRAAVTLRQGGVLERRSLQELRLMELYRQAAELAPAVGVSQIDDAMESARPKDALIALIMAAIPAAEAEAGGKRGGAGGRHQWITDDDVDGDLGDAGDSSGFGGLGDGAVSDREERFDEDAIEGGDPGPADSDSDSDGGDGRAIGGQIPTARRWRMADVSQRMAAVDSLDGGDSGGSGGDEDGQETHISQAVSLSIRKTIHDYHTGDALGKLNPLSPPTG
jgi:hypothetical protein